jgi:hypothetical protein
VRASGDTRSSWTMCLSRTSSRRVHLTKVTRNRRSASHVFSRLVHGTVKVLQSYNFALDLQLRAGNGFYDRSQGGNAQNYTLMVGFNWY